MEPARGVGLVCAGRDEAETLCGIRTAQELDGLLGPAPVLIVRTRHTEPRRTAPTVRKPTSRPPPPRASIPFKAGDAFAAGYLAALREGRAAEDGLRLGHLVAAATLSTREDGPPVVTRNSLALDNEAWSGLRLTWAPIPS
ncbi:PfkB family carbohydrate kinase [Streptomyces sp. NPDC050625]|uniref:PfkB family carbohydrate kinase n=1 Tax=Streptomyces sp. NPDC050625 TaxID=3154629 RepID=UPI00343D689D